eukprot:1733282-Prymnesium_polylepis.1
MASLPESGQGLRLYKRSAVYVRNSRAGPFEHHMLSVLVCRYLASLSLAISMSGCPPGVYWVRLHALGTVV